MVYETIYSLHSFPKIFGKLFLQIILRGCARNLPSNLVEMRFSRKHLYKCGDFTHGLEISGFMGTVLFYWIPFGPFGKMKSRKLNTLNNYCARELPVASVTIWATGRTHHMTYSCKCGRPANHSRIQLLCGWSV